MTHPPKPNPTPPPPPGPPGPPRVLRPDEPDGRTTAARLTRTLAAIEAELAESRGRAA